MPTWRHRWHARLLERVCASHDRRVAAVKRELFGRLTGVVVEIGAGAGVNARYWGPGVRWVAIEPDPVLRERAARAARQRSPPGEVLDAVGERLPLEDGSADAVVASFVLCSVRDPSRVLAEILRILRPGGTFTFVEHVAAPAGTWERRVQSAVRPCWSALGDGCEPDRDTEREIRAAGFASVEARPFRLRVPVVSPHLAGVARR